MNRKLGRDLYRKKQQTYERRETSAQDKPADPFPKNVSAEMRKREASEPLYIMRYE